MYLLDGPGSGSTFFFGGVKFLEGRVGIPPVCFGVDGVGVGDGVGAAIFRSLAFFACCANENPDATSYWLLPS